MQHKHDKGKKKLNSLVNKKLTKLVQLELRFSQRSDDHTPDINNTDINPNPFEYFPPKALENPLTGWPEQPGRDMYEPENPN